MLQRLVGEQRDGQLIQHAFQPRIAGRVPDDLVKAPVHLGGFGQRAFPMFHLIDQRFQAGAHIWRHVGAGQLHGFCFQHDAKRIDLLHLGFGKLHDEHAAPFQVHHQALLLQVRQRFAHRDTAGAELARDLAFVQPVARLVTPGQDLLAQRPCDMVPQG